MGSPTTLLLVEIVTSSRGTGEEAAVRHESQLGHHVDDADADEDEAEALDTGAGKDERSREPNAGCDSCGPSNGDAGYDEAVEPADSLGLKSTVDKDGRERDGVRPPL